MSDDQFTDQLEMDTPKIETPETDTPEDQRVSVKVRDILKLIESGKPSEQGYKNLWNNTLKYKHITEYERELVIAALEPIITAFPTKKSRSGSSTKDFKIKELLAKLLTKVSDKFPLENNRVRQGVKTGGAMMSGEKYVAAYFSYKSKEKWHVVFEIQQDSADKDPYIIVKIYHFSEDNLDEKIYEVFSIDDTDTALARYCEHLEFILKESSNAAV